MWDIHRIPLLNDNYAWALVDGETLDVAIVDPSDAAPVLALIENKGWNLRWILATHHHWDHTDGIVGLLESTPKAEVYGSVYDADHQRVPGLTRALADADSIFLNALKLDILDVPGHTLGAIAYYCQELDAVFTGDTLFLAGCGRLFEGTPSQMYASLSRLKKLPMHTLVYCGHEYTQDGLQFAATVMPNNMQVQKRLQVVKAMVERGEPTVPGLLAAECETNVFLRAADVAAFTALRKKKDVF